MATIFQTDAYILGTKFFTRRLYIASRNTGQRKYPTNHEAGHLLAIFEAINASRLTMEERRIAIAVSADRFIGAIMYGNELHYEMFFMQSPKKYVETVIKAIQNPQL